MTMVCLAVDLILTDGATDALPEEGRLGPPGETCGTQVRMSPSAAHMIAADFVVRQVPFRGMVTPIRGR